MSAPSGTRCCDRHHAEGCCDGNPGCCSRRPINPARGRTDEAVDELCAVLDGFDAIRQPSGDVLAVTRAQVDRWARQVGRALLVLAPENAEQEQPS